MGNLFDFIGLNIFAESPQYFRQYIIITFISAFAYIVQKDFHRDSSRGYLFCGVAGSYLSLVAADLLRHSRFLIFPEQGEGCDDRIIILPLFFGEKFKSLDFEQSLCFHVVKSFTSYPISFGSLATMVVYLVVIAIIGVCFGIIVKSGLHDG